MKLRKIIFSLSVAIFFCLTIILVNNPVVAYFQNKSTPIELNQTVNYHSHLIADKTDEVNIKTIPVRDNIYMLVGNGGNIGILTTKNGNLMIDSQFPDMSEKIVNAVNRINPKPVKYLINTHYHFDHTDGNENMAKLGATIIAHENTRKNLLVNHSYPVLGMKKSASPPLALPVITFEDKLQFNLAEEQIDLFQVPPAHTNGDIVVYFPQQNVIHVGDLLFNGFYPFIDTEVGGSAEGMIKAIDIVLSLCNDETLIIPGHGKLSNRAEFIQFKNMLSIVNERVKDAMSRNMSLEKIIEADLIADLNTDWGDGIINPEQMIKLTYNGLMKGF